MGGNIDKVISRGNILDESQVKKTIETPIDIDDIKVEEIISNTNSQMDDANGTTIKKLTELSLETFNNDKYSNLGKEKSEKMALIAGIKFNVGTQIGNTYYKPGQIYNLNFINREHLYQFSAANNAKVRNPVPENPKFKDYISNGDIRGFFENELNKYGDSLKIIDDFSSLKKKLEKELKNQGFDLNTLSKSPYNIPNINLSVGDIINEVVDKELNTLLDEETYIKLKNEVINTASNDPIAAMMIVGTKVYEKNPGVKIGVTVDKIANKLSKRLKIPFSVGYGLSAVIEKTSSNSNKGKAINIEPYFADIIAVGLKECKRNKTEKIKVQSKKVRGVMLRRLEYYQNQMKQERVVNNKKKQDKYNNEKLRNYSEQVEFYYDLGHMMGDASGGGHFPSWFNSSEYFHSVKDKFKPYNNGCRSTAYKKINYNDDGTIRDFTFLKDSIIFPKDWGKNDFEQIIGYIHNKFSKDILAGKKIFQVKHRNVLCKIFINSTQKSKKITSKSGKTYTRKVYNIRTVEPVGHEF